MSKTEDQLATKQISYINKDHQAQLVKQLEDHRVAQKKKNGSKNITQMYDIMSGHYESLKNQLGLDEALAPSSEDEKDEYI